VKLVILKSFKATAAEDKTTQMQHIQDPLLDMEKLTFFSHNIDILVTCRFFILSNLFINSNRKGQANVWSKKALEIKLHFQRSAKTVELA